MADSTDTAAQTAADPITSTEGTTESTGQTTSSSGSSIRHYLKDDNNVMRLAGLLLLALVVIGVVVGLAVAFWPKGSSLPAAGRILPTVPNPTPALADGVQSWTEYKAGADKLDNDGVKGNVMYDSLQQLHPEQGDIRVAVAKMADAEKNGKTFLWEAQTAGVTFINTDYRVRNGRIGFTFFYDKLKKGERFLTFADGTAAVKIGCANAVRFLKTVPGKVVHNKAKRHKPPKSKKCNNNTGQYSKNAKQKPGENVGKTPGYSRGSAETVTKQRQSAPKGGTSPTPSGTPGAGAGGTTPGGSGSGSAVPNPGSGQDIGGTVASP